MILILFWLIQSIMNWLLRILFVRSLFFVVSKYENVRAGIHSLGLPIDSRLIFRFFLFAPLVVLRCSVACSLCSCILYRLVSLAHRLPAWLDPRASWPDWLPLFVRRIFGRKQVCHVSTRAFVVCCKDRGLPCQGWRHAYHQRGDRSWVKPRNVESGFFLSFCHL